MSKITLLTRTIVFFCALTINSVFAHSPLVASSPENEEVLMSSPTELSLTFKVDVKLIQVHIKSESINQKFRPKLVEELKQHSIALPILGSGEYSAAWRALGNDGHLMKGKFKFSIAP